MRRAYSNSASGYVFPVRVSPQILGELPISIYPPFIMDVSLPRSDMSRCYLCKLSGIHATFEPNWSIPPVRTNCTPDRP